MRDETPASGPPDGSPEPLPPSPRLSGLARTLLLAAIVALAFVVGAVATTLLADNGPSVAPAAVNPGNAFEDRVAPTERAPLPEVELEGFGDGEPVDLAAYRGRPLLVNFWASWCAPCVKEMPDVEAVARDLSEELAVLGVNVQDAPANAEAFVDELGVTYDLATDPRGELYAEVEAFGMPTTLLVDAEGTIVYRHTGIADVDQLRALIAEHLGI